MKKKIEKPELIKQKDFYQGGEIQIDQQKGDDDIVSITLFCNGVNLMMTREVWSSVRKELHEADGILEVV